MAETLVLQLVGTQEVQHEILTEFSNEVLGAGARVNGRALGEVLVGLTDEELCEVISYRTLRNGACYARLDERDEAWALALLATDQPIRHAGDTIDIARAVARWLALKRPGVVVLEPLVITCAPNLATDELTAEMERLLVKLRDERFGDRVVVLPQGGTPASRVLLEHLAGRVFAAAGEVERLLPDGSGGSHTHSLLRTIEADFIARQAQRRLRDALAAGRYTTAAERAEDLVELGLASDELVRWCDAGRKIVDDQPSWADAVPAGDEAARRLRLDDSALGRLGAMTELVDRLERSGALRDALVTFVAAAELLSLAWCEQVAKVDEAQLRKLRWGQLGDCADSVRPDQSSSAVDQGRHAAICSTERCAQCPLTGRPAGKKILAAGGADVARALRQRPKRLVALRNDVVHLRKRQILRSQLAAAIENDLPGLRKCFSVQAPVTLAALLTSATRAAIGRQAPQPLAVVDAQIEALLG